MKSWFDTVRNDVLLQLQETKSISKYKELVYDGSMKIHTISELRNETEVGDYWIRGFLQIYETDQKLYYIGCSNCFSKIDVDPGITYDCHFCEKKVVSSTRPIVIMSVTDDTGCLEVVVVGKVAERIMQTTPEHINELKKIGETYDLNSIKTDFENKMFLMLLHQSTGKRLGMQRRPLLVAYYDEGSHNTLSPLKRQMNQMAISPESSSKRQLIMMPTQENTEDEHFAVVTTPETRTSDE
ncbi:hypothetical protein LIER_12186 [Lithospermum erythrorhizon]|uniref:Replication factor A C-terminal domain-containing protein n=1 Tax=Lithospermum erythrorhizon TaxID=34254 RepID=A0AAV3PQX0_LITER